MLQYLALIWLTLCGLAQAQSECSRCPRSSSDLMQYFQLIPVRLYSSEQLELTRHTRQQQIVQNIKLENNFGAPGAGFGSAPSFGRPSFGGGPSFGGRPSFGPRPFGGRGGGFRGDFEAGFGGGFRGGFGRSYEAEPAPAAPKTSNCNSAYSPQTQIPVPPCAQSFMISCEAVLKPMPCAAPAANYGY
ncbi:Vm26Ac [Drosophila busckii]|uniref:Vm26Ac n=1 Tax=Drosophila busckii TaxID=30019 RepID=A0A0M3QT66_DROBS|nr:calcium-binding protein CBP [Drosophila busckii]ALC38349.1 Vm26Ac [Drosophila busckii]